MQMITSRMRFMSSQLETPLRIVGLSTSLANARDVGEWIGASSHGLFNFPPGRPFFTNANVLWKIAALASSIPFHAVSLLAAMRLLAPVAVLAWREQI